jgi:hypothetical protein
MVRMVSANRADDKVRVAATVECRATGGLGARAAF